MSTRYRGYMMGELLVVIVIMAFLCLYYLPRYPNIDYRDYDFVNEYLYLQSEAMAKRERIDMEPMLEAPFAIYFSENGNVNQAQTITGQDHTITIYLGNGYIDYEK